jgi:hypothetical protein
VWGVKSDQLHGKSGEAAAKYLEKGQTVFVEGRLQTRTDELFLVPQSWVTGERFKPAVCGIKPQAPERTASTS